MAHKTSAALGGLFLVALVAVACGTPATSGFPPVSGATGSGSSSTGGTSSGSGGSVATGGTPDGNGGMIGFITPPSSIVDAGALGDGGELPDPNCPAGVHTSVSGLVYDPSFQDPLYNITVFAPKSATLPVLPKGITADSCTCDALYPSFYGSAVTDATGYFKVDNVPPGKNVPLVVQTGKWRKEFMIPSVTKCIDNPQPDKTLRMPKNEIMGDGNMPDFAISTGQSDSLECLLLRIGVDADEWVPGPSTAGHIHIFQGNGATTMPAAPASYMSLWDSTADLMNYDVTLLSCEGQETGNVVDANRQSLLDYSNAGGRVFASHWHYFWFNQGPFATYNLATWYPGNPQTLDDTMLFPGDVITTTLANGQTFPEGVALSTWLGVVKALDMNGMLDIFSARHNADVLPPAGPPGTPSQPWVVLDKSITLMVPPGVPVANGAEYFSVDTPIGAAAQCGRVVYSDLHVSGGAGITAPGATYMADYAGAPTQLDYGIVPSGCAMHPLTPQEKALEFMIFDLSSCLVPVGQTPHPPPPK
jgi:hypothetical protein